MPKHTPEEKRKNRSRKVKKRSRPIEGNKRSRKVKVPKDKFKTPVTESGDEFKEQKEITDAANRITTRKFNVPKPASLAGAEDSDTIAEGTGETPIANIPLTEIKTSRKRKVKRKKKGAK